MKNTDKQRMIKAAKANGDKVELACIKCGEVPQWDDSGNPIDPFDATDPDHEAA